MIKRLCTFVLLVCLCGISAVQAQPKHITHFIDTSNMDFSVKPGDDFYRYANGSWIRNNPVPASKTRWDVFRVLADEASNAMRMLLEEAASNPGKSRLMQMTGDFYASGMDSAAIEKAGLAPISVQLAHIAGFTTLQQVIEEIAHMRTTGTAAPLFGFSVGQDAKKASQYIPQLSQGGITLPDRDYYLKN